MNVNFGLMPPIPGRSRKADRKKMYTARAREYFGHWQAKLVRPREPASLDKSKLSISSATPTTVGSAS
jgi:hypothetical protein